MNLEYITSLSHIKVGDCLYIEKVGVYVTVTRVYSFAIEVRCELGLVSSGPYNLKKLSELGAMAERVG